VPDPKLEELCINTIRFLAVDAVQKANSGHPGAPMGAAPMAYVLWDRFLKHNPVDPKWPDRDRFLLSAGHAAAMLYALLYLTGYDLPPDARPPGVWARSRSGDNHRALGPGLR
jgi:transketolase